jgi:predicted phosphodiesterase
MKVAYCSDLHLEFKDLVLTNNVGADVLVLAGDICVGESLKRFPFYKNDEGIAGGKFTKREMLKSAFDNEKLNINI